MTGATHMVAVAAAILASGGAVLRASTRSAARTWSMPLLLVGWIGLVVAIAPASTRDHVGLLVVGLALAGALAWPLAGRLRGHERWLLAAGALVLTVRVPVPIGGDDQAMLLAPLYVVVAAGSLVLLRGDLARTPSVRITDRGWATRLLDLGTAALPVVATLSLLWTIDVDATARVLACFLVPFVLAYACVRSWSARGVSLRPATVALLGSTVAVALVGLWQAATRTVWWNPKVVDANRFRPDFRTNSLFWDPNIYGRALVVGLLALVAWMLVARLRARHTPLLALGTVAFVVALWNTYSQSSWFALAAALSVVAVLTLPPVPRRWVAAALLVIVLAGLPAAASDLSGSDTSGRADVVRAGWKLVRERPVLGWGMGAFETALETQARARGDRDPGLTASHTTPVTVVAELGVLGALAYLLLLGSATLAILARWRRTSASAARARATGVDDAATGWPMPVLIWATGTFVALVAQSLLYAGFFEDATLWVALALLASLPPVAPEDVEGEPDHSVASPLATSGVVRVPS